MRTVIFAIGLLCAAVASAQYPYRPLPFKGSDFKKIKELGYTRLVILQATGEDRAVATEVVYARNGFIDSVYEFGVNDDGDSTVTGITNYIFDEQGYLLSSTDESEGYSTYTKYTYNQANKLVRKQVVTIDPPTYTYKYDAKGRLAEVNVTQTMPEYEEDGEWNGKTFEKPSFRYTYKYDQKGRLSEEWEYYLPIENKTDPPAYKTVWTYNDKNQVIQVRRLNDDGTEMNRQRYEYNKEGLMSRRIFTEGGEDAVYDYVYCRGCHHTQLAKP